jgi:mRNA export factor
MNNPQKEHKVIQSPLKYQTRAVSCSPDRSNFALGSIEGRVAIHYVNDSQRGSDFAFKCHRDGNEKTNVNDVKVFAINCLAWHMQEGTFASGGSDGSFNFWDKDARSRCKAFERLPSPVTALGFSSDGKMFAYAQGYDWSRGADGVNPLHRPGILIHGVKPEEVKKKPPGSNNKR